ncbi:MAG: hypothetical protein HY046_05620, partial [Acidobacteria bacterium]|nr:hypothetical protein [Acidobacteriota bacterium]
MKLIRPIGVLVLFASAIAAAVFYPAIVPRAAGSDENRNAGGASLIIYNQKF